MQIGARARFQVAMLTAAEIIERVKAHASGRHAWIVWLSVATVAGLVVWACLPRLDLSTF